MPLARNSSRYAIQTHRQCTTCHLITDQTSVGCRYSDVEIPKVPKTYLKHVEWVCDWCGNCEEEIKEVRESTNQAKIVKRLLSIKEEYDVLGFTLSSERDGISIKFRLPDFDMGEMRAIQYKQQETGFITADELMKVQRAGYKGPAAVPPKLQPRDVATLRKRERQRAFAGGPRPYD
ncbi:MAG: hypothetical protein ACLP5V_02480 [Candidatus Bathyarchaeia archaeon]